MTRAQRLNLWAWLGVLLIGGGIAMWSIPWALIWLGAWVLITAIACLYAKEEE